MTGVVQYTDPHVSSMVFFILSSVTMQTGHKKLLGLHYCRPIDLLPSLYCISGIDLLDALGTLPKIKSICSVVGKRLELAASRCYIPAATVGQVMKLGPPYLSLAV